MKVVSWNVNSVRRRMQDEGAALPRLLGEQKPDIVCLQELQCKNQQVPREQLARLGYDALVCGEKGKNGVAILTRTTLGALAPAVRYPWPPVGAAPSVGREARFLAIEVSGVIVASVYAPYGREPSASQWQEKLDFFAALKTWSWDVIRQGQCLLLAGDFNVAPSDADVHPPAEGFAHAGSTLWPKRWSAWCHPQMRAAYNELVSIGLVDLGAKSQQLRGATLFDERDYGRETSAGVRVDHFLASLPMAARLRTLCTLFESRSWSKTSDHLPIVADFAQLHRVFACLTGSNLHGTSLPTSDVDIKGIVLPSVHDFYLGRGCSNEDVHRDKPRGEKNNAFDVDMLFFAPLEFVRLLVRGEPVAWEMLFAPPSMLLPDTTASGLQFMAALRADVPRLVSSDTRATLGAVKQFTRHMDHALLQTRDSMPLSEEETGRLFDSLDPKKLSHAVRVLGQSTELLAHGHISLPRPNAALLRSIKLRELPLIAIRREIEAGKDALEKARAATSFGVIPMQAGAELAVRTLIRAHLGLEFGSDASEVSKASSAA